MKVSATGLLTSVRDLLPKRATYENQSAMYKHMLDEMVKHIEMVCKGDATLQEFAEHYCITKQV